MVSGKIIRIKKGVLWGFWKLKSKIFPPFDLQMLPDSKNFLTWHKRPRLMATAETSAQASHSDDVAIVVQGAVLHKASFTLETCKWYRKAFPNAEVILSTWDSEAHLCLEEFRREGVHVVTSAKPEHAGISNCNLQLVSTQAGILEARRLGSSWVLKSRADQRVYSKTAISFFRNITGLFPCDRQSVDNPQQVKSRLISISLDTFKYRLFGLSDFLMFGQIEDMATYWGTELDRRIEIPGGAAATTPREYSKKEIVEVYFMVNFLRRIGWEVQWTLENYRSALAQHFVVIDSSSIDLYWPKYSSREHLWRGYTPSLLEPVTFSDWLMFYLASPVTLVGPGEEDRLDEHV